jgi:ribonuclease-3
MSADLQELETKLDHGFRDRELLVRALTHRSFSAEAKTAIVRPDNEQLEFFGDSILGFIISEALVTRYPGLPEGQLSRAKSYLVSARWLSRVAQVIGLGEFLQLGRGEELGGGRVKASLLANALEAVIAALYVDGGMEPARNFILTHVYAEPASIGFDAEISNYKGRLWELTGANKLPKPEYVVLDTSGPAHAPSFLVEARVGTQYAGRGEGSSKKAAEQQAARALLEEMDQSHRGSVSEPRA